MTTGENVSTRSAEWDEQRLESALHQLDKLHLRLRSLRSTIPKIIKPLTTPHDSPEMLFRRFAQASEQALQDIKIFTEAMRNESNRGLFEHATSSRASKTEGITPWLVTAYPGWSQSDHEKKLATESAQTQSSDGHDKALDPPRNVDATLEAFRAAHPDFQVSLDGDDKTIEIIYPSPTKHRFRIAQSTTNPHDAPYVVTCHPFSSQYKAALHHISQRQRPADLVYLLDMIASYSDLTSRPCTKCGKVINTKLAFPVVRRKERSLNAESKTGPVWNAYHAACT
ncbi:MAG: hypothetical protein M1825_000789 [Sarcosagium campestre]|nr:MAG: hypothetical protein M1825_000789 [Sarcosagium campestre]